MARHEPGRQGAPAPPPGGNALGASPFAGKVPACLRVLTLHRRARNASKVRFGCGSAPPSACAGRLQYISRRVLTPLSMCSPLSSSAAPPRRPRPRGALRTLPDPADRQCGLADTASSADRACARGCGKRRTAHRLRTPPKGASSGRRLPASDRARECTAAALMHWLISVYPRSLCSLGVAREAT